jgi:hypothetical protein
MIAVKYIGKAKRRKYRYISFLGKAICQFLEEQRAAGLRMPDQEERPLSDH